MFGIEFFWGFDEKGKSFCVELYHSIVYSLIKNVFWVDFVYGNLMND